MYIFVKRNNIFIEQINSKSAQIKYKSSIEMYFHNLPSCFRLDVNSFGFAFAKSEKYSSVSVQQVEQVELSS